MARNMVKSQKEVNNTKRGILQQFYKHISGILVAVQQLAGYPLFSKNMYIVDTNCLSPIAVLSIQAGSNRGP